jgi:hypothetical protein
MKYLHIITFLVIPILGCTSRKEQKSQITSDNDSIKVLLHTRTLRHFSDSAAGDTATEDRTVLLDYKIHSKYKSIFYAADSIYLNPEWGNIYDNSKKNEADTFVINTYKEILKTYVEINKYHGEYVFFSQDQENQLYSMYYVRDSVIVNIDMGPSWRVYYYQNISLNDGVFTIRAKEPSSRSKKYEIKVIDKVNDIQIWRQSYEGEGASYYLMAPLDFALRLPILVIKNSLWLDMSFEGLDKLDLENIYNKK